MRQTIGSVLVLLLSSACQGELHGRLDILPQQYPNRLESGQAELEMVLFSPPGLAILPRSPQASVRALDAESDAQALAEARGSVAFRDLDGDGRQDAVARFAVADVLPLLGPRSHGLELRIESDTVSWVGHDRLFSAEAPLVELPAPGGPHAVGTAELLGLDASRPGPSAEGRTLLVRLWYPAAASDVQPAPYFLDPERAAQNLAAGPFVLPRDLFELTHGSARAHVPPLAPEPRPVLLLSTGWDAPVESYSALAEEFASHGYLVLGVNHPNGSGAVLYPDGSTPGLDPVTVQPDEANNADWALDLTRLADWIVAGGGALRPVARDGDLAAAAVARLALAQADPRRIAALGHSFGGAAALRADAESPAIRASVNLDGPVLGDSAAIAGNARALLLLSPAHSPYDSSIQHFSDAAGETASCYAVDGTLHADYGDSAWLFERLLAENPDLQREGYGLGSIGPARAFAVVSGAAREFLETELAGGDTPRPLGAAFPELLDW